MFKQVPETDFNIVVKAQVESSTHDTTYDTPLTIHKHHMHR